ncbi:MAG: 3-phosphoserine/phosphohydroxythreonine transaminase [Planctomycetia bacterium]|nr:3-phosphoserine/phosphohydroxythreonine transaminase [Planctomycetia bacterium]
MERVYNFSPGPAVLPESVLREAQRDLLALPGVGVSVLEIGHRTKWFENVLETTKSNVRRLLDLPANYQVLFLQGGSRLQFSMIPMNLLPAGRAADYIVTGSWGQTALDEAQAQGEVRVAYSGKSTNFDRLPAAGEIKLNPAAAYVHYTSNETIQGVQFAAEPAVGDAPLVCDASSDFLSRPLAMRRYGLLYACAQKNAGPAGVTITIVRDDVLARANERVPTMLSYRQHAEHNSLLNTPPVFAVYVVMLVTRWLLEEIGGLTNMQAANDGKARLLYEVIDASNGFYRGHAKPDCRSAMNVTFRLPDDAVEEKFVSEAKARGLHYLKGHRSVGGIRASIYNAMPTAGVQALADFMREFRKKQ